MASSNNRVSAAERKRRDAQSAQSTGAAEKIAGVPADYSDDDLDELVTAEQVLAGERFMDDALAVNLDEVSPEPVFVRIQEYHEEVDPVTNVKRRRRRERRAEIETFVPMKIFNRMMAERNRATKARRAWQQAGGDEESDPMLLMMQRAILSIWQLTEPDMTMEQLEEGLDFMKVQGLFGRFFGALLRQNGSKASADAHGTGA